MIFIGEEEVFMFALGRIFFVKLIVFVLWVFQATNCYSLDAPYEPNDSFEEAYFLGPQEEIRARLETVNDNDIYKIIVIEHGMVEINYKPQPVLKFSNRFYFNILNEQGNILQAKVITVNHYDTVGYSKIAYTFDKGIYFIQLKVDKYHFDQVDQNKLYSLKINQFTDGTLSATPCTSNNLSGCVRETDCKAFGGYWYDNQCQRQPCNAHFLALCPDEPSCIRAGGYWSHNLQYCFNGDISSFEKHNCSTCASYNVHTGNLHIPCLVLGKNYWLDLKLINVNPIQLQLISIGEN